MNKQYGYKPPVIEEKNYVLGGILSAPFEVLQENGSWIDYLPVFEEQRIEGFDTNGCTVFNTLNCLEILFKKKFGDSRNYCERFIGVVAENAPDGNDPHKVAEAIRHFGNIDDFNLPFSKNLLSFEEYYSPKPMSKYYLDLGLNWLKQFEFKHEYVFNAFTATKDKPKKLIEALKSSPIGVSVAAWHKNDEGLYDKVFEDNHWTTLIDYKENEYWLIWDSYIIDGSPLKKLVWDYDFGTAKRYWIEKKEVFQLSILEQIVNILKGTIAVLAELVKNKIGKI